jgi:hypothetical protein
VAFLTSVKCFDKATIERKKACVSHGLLSFENKGRLDAMIAFSLL